LTLCFGSARVVKKNWASVVRGVTAALHGLKKASKAVFFKNSSTPAREELLKKRMVLFVYSSAKIAFEAEY
jgi:hypothetical protein